MLYRILANYINEAYQRFKLQRVVASLFYLMATHTHLLCEVSARWTELVIVTAVMDGVTTGVHTSTRTGTERGKSTTGDRGMNHLTTTMTCQFSIT